MPRLRTASFDVFDTCLARQVIAPSEVFREIARAIRPTTGDEQAWEEDFLAARIEAEARARRQAPAEEVTLEQIWNELARMLGATLPANDPNLELTAEAKLLGAITPTLNLLRIRREKGLRIAFLSDTYLPASFVRDQLARHGFFQPDDGLYVSSELLKTKYSGNLFRHFLATEKLAAHEVLHLGDHLVADREAPSRLGIQTEHFALSAPVRIERLLLNERSAQDHIVTTTAGLHRARRLAAATSTDTGAAALVENFLGPFTCLFGHWILRKASQHRLTRLYFAARDARLLFSVCRRLQHDAPEKVDCRYLHISRQSLLLASSNAADTSSLAWLRRDFESATLGRIARQLDIEPERIVSSWKSEYAGPASPDTALSSSENWARLWKILAAPHLADVIAKRVEIKKSAAQVYLRGQDLSADARSGLVDLGWYLTCQQALNRLIASPGSTPVEGLYLGLKQNRRGPAEAGPAHALFHWPASDIAQDRQIRTLSYRETLLEHIVGLADHPTVVGYSPEGRPTFASDRSACTESPDLFSSIHEELETYVDQRGDIWREVAGDDYLLREVLSTLIHDFFSHPDTAILKLLGPLSCSPFQGRSSDCAVAEPYKCGESLSALGHALTSPHRTWLAPQRTWPEAAHNLSSPAARAILRLGQLTPGVRRRLGL